MRCYLKKKLWWKIVKRCQRNFFENNLNKDTEVRMVQDANKAIVRGYFIQCDSELKKGIENSNDFG